MLRIYSTTNDVAVRVKSDLATSGIKIFEINTHSVPDRDSFFKAALSAIPMGDATRHPEMNWAFPQNWAAFSDFVWQGLSEQAAQSVLFWIGSAELRSTNPELYTSAIAAITESCDDDSEESNRLLALILVGTGAGFTDAYPDIHVTNDN